MAEIRKEPYNSDFKFTTNALIDMAYIYGEIVKIFEKIVKKDLNNIININYTHINTRMAIREQLIKTPKSLLTYNKPILSLNTRLDMEYDGGVLSPLAFNTDLSHILDVRSFSDPFIITHDREDNGKNIAISFSFKRIKLVVEVNLIEDHRQQLINLFHFWRAKRYPQRLYRKTTYISFPIPKGVYMEYCRSHNLDPSDKLNVYHHIKKQSFYPVIYKKNLNNGNTEIFLKYETYMDYTAGGANLTDGIKTGNITKDYILTRPFDITINVPSMCFIRLDRERFFLWNDNVPIEDAVELGVKDWVRYDWMEYEEDDYKEIINAHYDFSQPTETIDCKRLLYDNFIEFYNFLKQEGLLIEDYIKIRYFKNRENNEDNTYLINTEEMLIIENDADMSAEYTIALYVKLGFYNEWLENHIYSDEKRPKTKNIINLPIDFDVSINVINKISCNFNITI